MKFTRPKRGPVHKKPAIRTLLAAALINLLICCAAVVSQTVPSSAGVCLNLNCPAYAAGITYHHGPLVTAPHVFFVRFSDSRTTLSPGGFLPQTFASSSPNLAGALDTILHDPAATWWMKEYSTSANHITGGTFGGVLNLYAPALADMSVVSAGAADNVIWNAATITDPVTGVISTLLPDVSANAVYVVVFRAGQTVTGLDGCANHTQGFRANADGTNTAFPIINLPEKYSNCTPMPTPTLFDLVTTFLSHEVVEAITDPVTQPAWKNTHTDTELADACQGGGLNATQYVAFRGGNYRLSHIWSIQAQACLSTPLATSLRAHLLSPTRVSAVLTSHGFALAHQRVTVEAWGRVIAKGVTNSRGGVLLIFAVQLRGTRLSVLLTGVAALRNTSVALRITTGPVGEPPTATTTTTAPVTSTPTSSTTTPLTTTSAVG